MKLGKRLHSINQMVVKHYDHIWDCCCDHGLLGMHLLMQHPSTTIHFVDTAPSLIETLESQLLKYYPDDCKQPSSEKKWQVHCLSAESIFLQDNTSNLIIIAGVGGELLIEIVEAIVSAHPNKVLAFLLCPVHHNYKVRQALIRLNLGLVDEKLIKENKRFYEVIYVTTDTKQAVSSVGSLMWDFSREDDRLYFQQTLNHYERMLKTDNASISKLTQEILTDYQKLHSTFNS